MNTTNDIAAHLASLQLPPEPTQWLHAFWDAIQFLDDCQDGDFTAGDDVPVSRILLDYSVNPFFVANVTALAPAVALVISKWRASNAAEKDGLADARSFMWRAGYYDLVLLVFTIVHGHKKAEIAARDILSIYGETLEDYMKEMGVKNA